MLNTDRLCINCMNDNGGEKICPLCGYDQATRNPSDALPAKFWLSERYMVGRPVLTNSEGISYTGWDNAENIPVIIREYFPAGAAVRNPDKTVSMVVGREFIFNEGLLEYIEINKKISECDYQAVMPVNAVFEENGTAYTVKPEVSGISLKEFLERNGGMLKWEQARPLFLPLIDGIIGLNDMGIIHGGISPESILVGRDGKLRIDGISISRIRRADSDMPSGLYSGYAAIEQYGVPDMHIDGYTDVYGIGATLFRVLIGIVPPAADERISNDELSIPAQFADELPRQVLVALANSLQVKPENRTATVEDFRNELVYGEMKQTPKAAASAGKKAEDGNENKPKKGNSSVKYAVIAAVCTILVFALIFGAITLLFDPFGLKGEKENSNINSGDISAPEVPMIGDVDPDVDTSIKYEVPDFTGNFFSQIEDMPEFKHFQVVIKGKDFSTQPKGAICKQSPEAGAQLEYGGTVEITISLGKLEVTVPNVTGLTKDQALVELLKKGFLYENIEVVDKYDADSKPDIIIGQEPNSGAEANTESKVRIYYNTYTGDEPSGDESKSE